MTSLLPEHLRTLESIASDMVAPSAVRIDVESCFPAAAIDGLARAGLLGAVSAADVGGLGLGPRAAAQIVERLARECGSTAMVATMHYCGVVVLEKHAGEAIRRDAAAGRHLSTLAFSEAGSRSHFWAPVSSARRVAAGIQLDARKSWITSANAASAYVWSSRPLEADGMSTLWLVPRDGEGLFVGGRFDGLGLRGNDSSPVTANSVVVPESSRLGPDGGGFDLMIGTVLPLFNVLESACSLGFMETAVARTVQHACAQRYEHDGTALRDLPTVRNTIARMRCKTDMAKALLDDTISALESSRLDAMLRVLEVKAATADAANEVLDLAMRVCGGMAFRKDVGVERIFRDARAAGVMAPTTDVLYEFIGKACCNMDLFG
jgi:alkylation response protein AidB-like acyl-CoA dehydrogenase